jgi:hypothetical protein
MSRRFFSDLKDGVDVEGLETLLVSLQSKHRRAQLVQSSEAKERMAELPPMETTSRTIRKLRVETAQENFLSPFFGDNIPPPKRAAIHPCQTVSARVHKCLDENNNDGRFCQSIATLLESCVRSYDL